MIKIEADTLEEAYSKAASSLNCSVTELATEVVQSPSAGILGFFKKTAIIVATKDTKDSKSSDNDIKEEQVTKKEIIPEKETVVVKEEAQESVVKEVKKAEESKLKAKPIQKVKKAKQKVKEQKILNDTIMPESFVNTQDDEEQYDDPSSYLADYDDEEDNLDGSAELKIVAKEVEIEINSLFSNTCFKIDKIIVSVYDDNTLLMELQGDDSALLIGKEGYRYKALSYMMFNWINTRYQLQLRLEIAEFLKNQEESVARYLETIYEIVDRDGRAQTKILDGVLVQIALGELRDRYHDKYVAVRTTRDGFNYIIINDYRNN